MQGEQGVFLRSQDSRTSLDLELLGRALRERTTDPVLLCYGIGAEDQGLSELQQNLLDSLSQLAANAEQPMGAVLLAGNNLQSVANTIVGQAEHVVLLHENSHRSESLNDAIECRQQNLLDLDVLGEFELLVIEGSIHYLQQLPVLEKARRLLSCNGRLLLIGEYLADDSLREYSPLANLESLRRLAKRLGFDISSESDLSAGARLTLQKLNSILDSAAFDEDEFLTSTALAELRAGIEAIDQEFQCGRRCLQLLELHKGSGIEDEWANAEFSAIDSFSTTDIAELFEKSFQVSFDAEVWEWKYRLGRGQCVVARTEPGGKIVSHYGGAPRKIEYFGEAEVAIQVCDVMVLPEVRLSYGKSSLFFRTAATFLEREIGYSVNHLLGFGFPNQKAMNIAIRLGLYEKTDEFVEIVCAHGSAERTGWRVEELDFQKQRNEIDALWMRMREDFDDGIIGVRDSEYFDYRYLQHPFAKRGQYRHLQIVDPQGRLQAIAVTTEHGEQELLLELIAVRADMAESVAAVSAFCESQDSGKSLKFWLTRSALASVELPHTAVHELGIEIPCNSWNAGPPAEKLRDKWWLTAGDMDFL